MTYSSKSRVIFTTKDYWIWMRKKMIRGNMKKLISRIRKFGAAKYLTMLEFLMGIVLWAANKLMLLQITLKGLNPNPPPPQPAPVSKPEPEPEPERKMFAMPYVPTWVSTSFGSPAAHIVRVKNTKVQTVLTDADISAMDPA